MIFHENRLPADVTHKISYLIIFFQKDRAYLRFFQKAAKKQNLKI